MIYIKLLESWLPIPSAASMLHPPDIAISHEKDTWTVRVRTYKLCNLKPCYSALSTYRAILILFQRLGNNITSFIFPAKRNLYHYFGIIQILGYMYNYYSLHYSGVIGSSLPTTLSLSDLPFVLGGAVVWMFPGVPIPIWRRGKEERLIHTGLMHTTRNLGNWDILVIFCATVT